MKLKPTSVAATKSATFESVAARLRDSIKITENLQVSVRPIPGGTFIVSDESNSEINVVLRLHQGEDTERSVWAGKSVFNYEDKIITTTTAVLDPIEETLQVKIETVDESRDVSSKERGSAAVFRKTGVFGPK